MHGWHFLILWKDGDEQWIPLKDLKESHPVEVSEFTKARDISHKPAFSWWVPYRLRKHDVIFSAINTRIRKTMHKYGIEITRTIEHANNIDAKNGNSVWRTAIMK